MKRWYFVLIVFSISNIVLIGSELVPIPTEIKVDNQKVQLGKKLFLDPILSKDKTLSCMSCHNLKRNGADRVRRTKGIDGQVGYFNVPTVYNAVYNFRQFWDGRAKDLKDQALQPIVNPVEMGNTMENALKSLKADNTYVSMFNIIYEDGITEENLAEVITEFEKTLITPNAPFDKYLRGDKNAISKNAIRGYQLFKSKGCVACHNGINIGGNLFNKFGIYEEVNNNALGRYSITQKEEDKYVFKVPSLRNIALTAPYMHDGRASSLKEAVNLMVKHQLGRRIYGEDLRDIVSFLQTLTGELPEIVKDINVTNKK
jgi:cytochrome c peroxidase